MIRRTRAVDSYTNFKGESSKSGAAGASGEPKKQRIRPGIPFGFHEIIKQLHFLQFPDAHISVPFQKFNIFT